MAFGLNCLGGRRPLHVDHFVAFVDLLPCDLFHLSFTVVLSAPTVNGCAYASVLPQAL